MTTKPISPNLQIIIDQGQDTTIATSIEKIIISMEQF